MEYYDKYSVPITEDEWSRLFADKDYRRVGWWHGEGGIVVSTVWLGLNHNFLPNSLPAIFETMVFGGPWGEAQMRYATLEMAETGHEKAVDDVIHGRALWFMS